MASNKTVGGKMVRVFFNWAHICMLSKGKLIASADVKGSADFMVFIQKREMKSHLIPKGPIKIIFVRDGISFRRGL